MNASIWTPGAAPVEVNPADSIKVQRFVATAGQSVFTLTEFTYALGANALHVFKNGLALARVTDFEETSTSSFTLELPANANDIIYVVGFTQIDGAVEEATEAAALAVATALAIGKLYLGAKASNPTVDNQGAALQNGALYFNTVANQFRVYELATTTWYAGVTAPNPLRAGQITFAAPAQLVAKASIAVADAVTTSKITASMQSKVGDTLGDELEMDAFVISGRCLVNGTIVFTARCVSGFARGTYNFNYFVEN